MNFTQTLDWKRQSNSNLLVAKGNNYTFELHIGVNEFAVTVSYPSKLFGLIKGSPITQQHFNSFSDAVIWSNDFEKANEH